MDKERIVTYADLKQVLVSENNERFVSLNDLWVKIMIINNFSDLSIGNRSDIYVRETVWKLLKEIANDIFDKYKIDLVVTFWYRSLDIQRQRFLQRLQNISNDHFFEDPIDLYEEVHKTVAVPSVAWHPTWGAVDVLMVTSNDTVLDFWHTIYDYSKSWYATFTKDISEQARNNRIMLRSSMMDKWFAPFDGEYWHFSYGDREWAYYYDKPYAIYSQLNPGTINIVK